MTRSIGKVGLAALACAAVLAVGCGDDDDAAEAPDAAAASGLDGKPVKFGNAAAYSGHEAFLGSAMRSGIEVALDEINGNGGIDGRPVELVVGDTKGNETAAVTAISKLIDVDNVSALVGPTSLEIFSVIDTLKEKGVPTALVAGAAELDEQMGGETMWRLFPSDSVTAPVVAGYAMEQGFGTAGMLFEDQESAQGLKDEIEPAYTALGGEIVREIDPALMQSEYRAEATEACDDPLPKVTFYQMAPETAATFWQNAAEVCTNLPDMTVLGGDILLDRESLDALGPAVDQLKLFALTPIPAGPADEYYEQKYEERHNKDTPDTFSANVYDATILYALAAISAGDPSREGISSHMRRVSGPQGETCLNFAECKDLLGQGKRINYEGASGTMDFDDKGNVLGPFGVYEYKDGDMQQVSVFSQEQVAESLAEAGTE
jgi:ABC-type branched-subunit amino acid transport system substrate-binding protein